MTMAMGSTADTTRRRSPVWRGDKGPFHWRAIYTGHSQPRGYRNFRHNRYQWRFHLTPVCAARQGEQWAAGLCFGKRMIYFYSHR